MARCWGGDHYSCMGHNRGRPLAREWRRLSEVETELWAEQSLEEKRYCLAGAG